MMVVREGCGTEGDTEDAEAKIHSRVQSRIGIPLQVEALGVMAALETPAR